jgi:hypothetical protein
MQKQGKALSTTLRAQGKALEKPLLPERLNGTDTKVGKGSGADENQVRDNHSTTLGDMANHLQAKKSKPHLPAGL